MRALAMIGDHDITIYRFKTPGTHSIEWKLGGLQSNVIKVQVR